MSKIKRGLYVITDAKLTAGDKLLAKVELALKGGAVMVQYRNKTANFDQRLKEAQSLVELCGKYDVPLIINDDVDLARRVNASGVHLGASDSDIGSARDILGPSAIIGASCYNQMNLAHKAVAEGASYVAFGRFFKSSTKPDAVQADLSLIAKAKQELQVPVVAIGGINLDNVKTLVEYGVDMAAVVGGVFGNEDTINVALSFENAFSKIHLCNEFI
jgi:thiamine-phosphate pyrophosphorylase